MTQSDIGIVEKLRDLLTRATPGPWHVDYNNKRGGNIIAPTGPVASTRWFGVTHKQVMEDYANADLIALVPEAAAIIMEMVEALEEAHDTIRSVSYSDHPLRPGENYERRRRRIDKLLAKIAKVRSK